MEKEEIKQIVKNVLEELDYAKDKETQKEEREFIKQKKVAFYSVVMDNVIQLRLQITNLLITISAAMIAALPYFYAKNPNKFLFTFVLVLFGLEIILGLAMHELDSKQLLSLEKSNNGKEAK